MQLLLAVMVRATYGTIWSEGAGGGVQLLLAMMVRATYGTIWSEGAEEGGATVASSDDMSYLRHHLE